MTIMPSTYIYCSWSVHHFPTPMQPSRIFYILSNIMSWLFIDQVYYRV